MSDRIEAVEVAPSEPEGSARSCGGCTVCCEGWLTDQSMKLFPGSGCQHICAEGCGIYESRPEIPCRSFKCAWLTEPEEFPDAMRPDRSGVIPIKDRNWYGWKVIRAFPRGSEVPAEALEWLVEYAKPKQMPVIFYKYPRSGEGYRGVTEQALGPAAFAAEVKRRPSDADTFTSFDTTSRTFN